MFSSVRSRREAQHSGGGGGGGGGGGERGGERGGGEEEGGRERKVAGRDRGGQEEQVGPQYVIFLCRRPNRGEKKKELSGQEEPNKDNTLLHHRLCRWPGCGLHTHWADGREF